MHAPWVQDNICPTRVQRLLLGFKLISLENILIAEGKIRTLWLNGERICLNLKYVECLEVISVL